MHFNVRIIENKVEPLDDFIFEAKKHFPNIILEKEENYQKLLEKKEFVDLIIIDTTCNNSNRIIEEYINANKYILFICDNENEINTFENFNKYDIIFKPLNFKILIEKLQHYINLLNKDLLLKKEQELSNSIINNISNPIFLTNGDKVIYANDYFLELTGEKTVEMLNHKYSNIGDIFEKEKGFLNNISGDWLKKTSNENTKVCIKEQEKKRYFSIQKLYLTQNNKNIIILNDISHEIHHKQELFNLLYTDNLTKLPNRSKLIEDLQNNSLEKLEAISILDINSFKEINDFFGHKIGDCILIEISKLIEKSIQNKENNLKLYKFPSDTYCVTNTSSNKEEFISLINSIIETVYKKVFTIKQHEIDVRITAGISFSNKNNKLITADIALQSAKKDHKDYLVFYDELDKFQEYENNMLWTKKLKNAFSKDQIEVYFQPLVNNYTLEVQKYECLVRLIDDDGKVISPYFFLDISKKSNQYTKITKIVIEKSFKKFDKLPFEFSVNISYEDIEDPEFLSFIKKMLKKYDVSNKVVFEILENENVKNYEFLIKFIDEVKNLGCKVAIDDFGSGYSNFEHLLKMNVDYLKIDASLIKNVATDENSYKITKTIIDFAKSLNLKTIAEFVENEEIFEIVKELGSDFSQGYYFSAPISEPHVKNFKSDKDE